MMGISKLMNCQVGLSGRPARTLRDLKKIVASAFKNHSNGCEPGPVEGLRNNPEFVLQALRQR